MNINLHGWSNNKDVKKVLMGKLFRGGQDLNQNNPLHWCQGSGGLVKIYLKLQKIINRKTFI